MFATKDVLAGGEGERGRVEGGGGYRLGRGHWGGVRRLGTRLSLVISEMLRV